MLKMKPLGIWALGVIAGAAPAAAQLGFGGSSLPAISRISAANAAGVLQYCEGKDLVSSASTDAVLNDFQTRPDVKSSDYAAGVHGEIRADNGRSFSISKVSQDLALEACDMVLQRAKSLNER